VGNPVSLQYSDGTTLQYAYDDQNLLTSGSDISLTRDAEGRVVGTGNFDAAYDAAGRLESVSYANDAFTVTYEYDPVTGLLSNVSDNLTEVRLDFSYDEDSLLVDIARSNGVDSQFNWDAAGRLVGIQDGDIIDLQFDLDAAGQAVSAQMEVPLSLSEGFC